MNVDITHDKEKNEIELNKRIYAILKRIIDIILACFGCVLLIPLTIIIWIANKVFRMDIPIFYKQKRIGKDGKVFILWKYCSMKKDAENELKKYLENNKEAAEEFRKYRKLKNDPRVIKPFGSFIRKTNLDEFPQFINVLKGDMSLIGPRPYLLEEQELMKEAYEQIIKVRPGITGAWQVSGRNKIEFEDRLKIETKYVQEMNILVDLKIFIKTMLKVITNKI